MVTIRLATPDDVSNITRIKNTTWQSEQSNIDLIASAITRSDHITHIACIEDTPAGFVSGFTTVSAKGVVRWEVDLLAVDPQHRGQGIAPQLIEASVQAGLEQGVAMARALVAVDNLPAERSFTRSGFQPEEFSSELYVSHGDVNMVAATKRVSAHLIPVETFSYRGIWVEEAINPADFQFANSVINRLSVYGWHLAGAVVPTSRQKSVTAAQEAGYEHIGAYRNWMRPLK